ncbi:MAG: PIN domain-containing protein [Myxococcota bacterium]|jgi:hypothetical protein
MSGKGTLVDSVIVIDHLNGIREATEYLRQNHANCRVSAITVAEVLAGLEGAERDKAAGLLDCFAFLPLDREDAVKAAELRKTHGWKLPDAFQAALARLHGLKLVTRDEKAFKPEKHSFVLVPYRV